MLKMDKNDFINNKAIVEIKKSIYLYKEGLDSLLSLEIKKLKLFKNSDNSNIEHFHLLFDNIIKEKNQKFQKEQLQSIKNELKAFKNSNFNLLKNLMVNLEREYKVKQKYIENIINELDLLDMPLKPEIDLIKTNFDNFNEKNKSLTKEEEEYYNINNFKNVIEINLSSQVSIEDNLIASISSNEILSEKEIEKSSRESSGKKSRIKSNRPKNSYWNDNKNTKECSLCGLSSGGEVTQNKKLGPLYGPFSGDKQKYYVHEMCAMYSPNIYLDTHNKLKNVRLQIEKSKKIICLSCDKPGASVKCCTKKCKKYYHYLCGKKEGCHFDNQSFDLNCSEHLEDKIYHEDVNSDIQCVVCNSGLDEDLLLLCGKCQSGCHIYCNKPKLRSVPEYDWVCGNCLK